jgi:hypothetical protein
MVDPNKEWMAFPVATIDGYTQYGMTLRDYFAGEAVSSIMTAFINNPEKDALEQGAELAYMLADAMMKAREQ